MAQRKKPVIETRVPLESPVTEDSWVSPIMAAAIAGESVVFDMNLVDPAIQSDQAPEGDTAPTSPADPQEA